MIIYCNYSWLWNFSVQFNLILMVRIVDISDVANEAFKAGSTRVRSWHEVVNNSCVVCEIFATNIICILTY